MKQSQTTVGRPTKLTPLIVKKLEEVFALDGSIQEACFYAGISRQTYYVWIKENPEYSDRFESLRMEPVLKARRTVVAKLGENYHHAMDYLKRKCRDEFSDNKTISFGHKSMGEILDELEKSS